MGEGRPHTIYKVCSVYKKTIVNALLIHYQWPSWQITSDHLLAQLPSIFPIQGQPAFTGLIAIQGNWNWGARRWVWSQMKPLAWRFDGTVVLVHGIPRTIGQYLLLLYITLLWKTKFQWRERKSQERTIEACAGSMQGPPPGCFSYYKSSCIPTYKMGLKYFFFFLKRKITLKSFVGKMLYREQALSSSSIEPLYFFLCPEGNNKLTYFLSSEILLRPQCDCTPCASHLSPLKTHKGEKAGWDWVTQRAHQICCCTTRVFLPHLAGSKAATSRPCIISCWNCALWEKKNTDCTPYGRLTADQLCSQLLRHPQQHLCLSDWMV